MIRLSWAVTPVIVVKCHSTHNPEWPGPPKKEASIRQHPARQIAEPLNPILAAILTELLNQSFAANGSK
jgi:hypothetical protein